MNNVMVSLDWHYRLHYRLIYNPAHFNSFVGLHGAVFLSRDLEVSNCSLKSSFWEMLAQVCSTQEELGT